MINLLLLLSVNLRPGILYANLYSYVNFCIIFSARRFLLGEEVRKTCRQTGQDLIIVALHLQQSRW